MTREEAMKRLTDSLGACARFHMERYMTSPERRQEAQNRLAEIRAERATLRQRPAEMFGPKMRDLERRERRAMHESDAYRFRIYQDRGFAAVEVAKGDTWDDVFRELDVRRRLRG